MNPAVEKVPGYDEQKFDVRVRFADGGYTLLCTVVKPILDERRNEIRTEGAAIPEYE